MKLPKITKRSIVVASAIVAVTFSGGVAVFAFSQAPEPPHAVTEVKTNTKEAKKEEKSDTSDQTPSEVQTTGQTDQSAAIPVGDRPDVHSSRNTEARRPVAQPQPASPAPAPAPSPAPAPQQGTHIPFTNKPVTPGDPESYAGTVGQCPFYEMAGEKGCVPPAGYTCNSDWTHCTIEKSN
jgi:hypothetical protein|nr:MAG TPA: hypothetical protein [Caudoviricetes sp.]